MLRIILNCKIKNLQTAEIIKIVKKTSVVIDLKFSRDAGH
ncbi:hypothetical protein SHAM105786_06335 [Shewanella amazonensis]